MASPPLTDMSSPSLYAIYKDDPADSDISYEECFKPYEPFGLTYDAAKKQLLYNGRTVRWFEDYYSVDGNSQAGRDFFDENGVVDVYVVRDLGSAVRSEDGSFDPSGKPPTAKVPPTENFMGQSAISQNRTQPGTGR